MRQGCIFSPYLSNQNAEYIIRIAGLEENEYGFTIGGRCIANLPQVDDTILIGKNTKDLQALVINIKSTVEKWD